MPYPPGDLSQNPHFRVVENRWLPWEPVTKPLSEGRFALITMGGFYLAASQSPFTDDDNTGDTSFRALPSSVAPDELAIAHTHYPHYWVEQDLNSLFPIAHFRRLAAEGTIGSLAMTHYSWMGSIPDPMHLLSDSALEVAWRLRQEQVDYVVLSSA